MMAKVLLISNNHFLNTALKRILSEEMELECEISGLETMSSFNNNIYNTLKFNYFLVLIDCIGFEVNKILKFIIKYQNYMLKENCTTALYNLTRNSGVEKKLLGIGVRGVFYEDEEISVFKKGVSSLLEGDIWFPRRVLYDFIKEKSSCKNEHFNNSEEKFHLTAREKEILILISSGKSNAEIADELYISQSTVKTHIYNIFQKIKVPNRIQAALWTVKNLGG